MNSFNKDFIQYSDKKVKDETKHLALYFVIHIFLYVVLFFFALFFAWYTVFITTHKFYAVRGVSMMSTLNGQITDEQLYYDIDTAKDIVYDAVYIDKTTAPRLFDIVVVEKSTEDSVIKRLMAVGGDYITIAKGMAEGGGECFYFYRIPKGSNLNEFDDEQAKVLENGQNGYKLFDVNSLWVHYKTVQEYQEYGQNSYEYDFYNTFLKYYGDSNSPYNYHLSNDGLLYVQVPEGQVFYMGDNREYSADSRKQGFCNESHIVGRAEFVVYEFNFGNRLLEVVKFYFKEIEKFFAR